MDDDDLLDEIRNSADEPADAAPVTAAQEPRVPRRRASKLPTALLIGGVFLFLAGGVAFLLVSTTASDAFVYSKLVDEVMVDPDEYVGRELRVEGKLRRGSVDFQAEPTCEHRFVLTRGGHEMPVTFPRCVVPDTFRDDMDVDVVVQGELQANGTFLADQVIPRCPSKYEMRQRQQNGETMPHAVPGPTS